MKKPQLADVTAVAALCLALLALFVAIMLSQKQRERVDQAFTAIDGVWRELDRHAAEIQAQHERLEALPVVTVEGTKTEVRVR